MLQIRARDSADLSVPAVQVTTTLLTDEQQTSKSNLVDLPTPRVVARKRPTNEHSTNSSGPSESLDSDPNMQILTEAINNLVLPSLRNLAQSANSQSRYVLHVQYCQYNSNVVGQRQLKRDSCSGSQIPQPSNPEDSKLR